MRHEMTPQDRGRFHRGAGCSCCEGRSLCEKDGPCDNCTSFFNHACQESKFKPRTREARKAHKALRSVLGGEPDAPATEMEGLGAHVAESQVSSAL